MVYNENIRRYIIMMGDIFSDVVVTNDDKDIKVPIVYSSKEKFYTKLNSIANGRHDDVAQIEQILPRMALHMDKMTYDAKRKTSRNIKHHIRVNDAMQEISNPVPYQFEFSLSIATRHLDHCYQIIEQIAPRFQPSLHVNVREVKESTDTKRDIKITLNSLDIDDEYEGDTSTRRRIEAELNFTVDGWLYPGVRDIKGEILMTTINMYGCEVELVKQEENRETIVWNSEDL